jgi:hypothetical protein
MHTGWRGICFAERLMMEYVKVWTAFEDDEWIQSLNCNQRGLFLQLLLFGKRAGGLGVIVGRSYSALALRSGCDDSTCAKFLRKFANDGKIELSVSANRVVTVKICNYEFWQGLKGEKGVNEVVRNRRKVREESGEIRRINKSQAKPSQANTNTLSPSGDHRAFIEHWCTRYKEKIGTDYHFRGGKDGALVKQILGELKTLRVATEYVDEFMAGRDKWVEENGGYTIGVFQSQLNKIGQRLAKRQTAITSKYDGVTINE